MQDFVSVVFVGHGAPPFLGGTHVAVLVCVPVPQGLEQSDHAPHTKYPLTGCAVDVVVFVVVVVGHSCVLHGLSSNETPTQLFPVVQVRVRLCVPPPHGLEQLPNAPHAPHIPVVGAGVVVVVVGGGVDNVVFGYDPDDIFVSSVGDVLYVGDGNV
jgi:hypothetical protein